MGNVRVEIKNFQSIEDISFEVEGFGVLVGKTNLGKSAIIRAISSAIKNDSIVGMIRKGASSASVRLVSQEYDILWERGEKGLNRTTINGKLYDKTGSSQIDHLKELGFGPVSIGSSEVYPWHASQFSPVFLLDRPGSQVTDFISQISRLDVLQDAIQISARQKLRANTKAGEYQNRALEEKKLLVRLGDVGEFGALMGDIETQKASIESLENKINLMESHLKNLLELSSELRKIKNISLIALPEDDSNRSISEIAEMEKHYTELLKNNAQVETLSTDTGNIPDEIREVDELVGMIKYRGIDSLISRCREVNITIPEEVDQVEVLENMVNLLNQLHRKSQIPSREFDVPDLPSEGLNMIVELQSIFESLLAGKNEVIHLRTKNNGLEVELKEIVAEIATIPTCPSCDQVVCNQPTNS